MVRLSEDRTNNIIISEGNNMFFSISRERPVQHLLIDAPDIIAAILLNYKMLSFIEPVLKIHS
jgi:hypothetical protein